jgi:hypothetical protein
LALPIVDIAFRQSLIDPYPDLVHVFERTCHSVKPPEPTRVALGGRKLGEIVA